MLVSTLIEKLQNILNEHGDITVIADPCEHDYDVQQIRIDNQDGYKQIYLG